MIICRSAPAWLGRGHFERSELEEAMRLWTEAEELCIRNNIWGDRVQAFRGYARVFLKQGRPHAAQEKLSEALQIASKLPEYQRLSVLMDLVRPLSELGNSEEAIKVAEEVRTYYEQPTNAAKLLGAYRACVEAYIGAGDRNKALEYHDLLRKSERRFFDEQYRNGLKASEAKLELERERSETQMQALKAEQYEQQLSNSTLQLVAQTELLTELRDGLLQFIRKFPLPDGAAKELRERLKTLPCKSVDWERFDTQFKSAHPEFTKKLIEKHPTLTPMELRICSLLRMNLRSAEIARLFCLSERTVEHHRAHIRTKMKIETREDLIKVLAAM